jgi:hypothetical protein
MTSIEEVAKDVQDRLESIGKAVEPEQLKTLIRTCLADLKDDDPEFQKIMAGAKSDPELIGTKYARWGLQVADVEFLYELQDTLRTQRRVNGGVYSGPSETLTTAFRNISEARYLTDAEVREIDKKAIDDLFPRIPKNWVNGTDRILASMGRFTDMAAYQRAIRAMDTAESGFGQQLVGAQYQRDLWEASRAESRVANLIDTFEMTDATAYIPVEVDIPELIWVSESTTNNASAYATVKTGSNRVQIDAKKFAIHQMWSGEMEEDSIIPFVPFLRRQATLALAHYMDSLVLNGDTTNAATGNINLDDADPADTKHYLAFDAIRHAALVDNTGNFLDVDGQMTLDHFRRTKGLMLDPTRIVDWGHPTNNDDLVFVADPETADQIAMLDEVIKVKQMMGANANLLGGEVGRIIGHPVISSMAVSKTEADGKVSTTAANNIKGQVVAFNRRGFKIGWRRRIKIETERLPATDQTRIVYTLRAGFGRFTPTGAASGIEAAVVLGNVTI